VFYSSDTVNISQLSVTSSDLQEFKVKQGHLQNSVKSFKNEYFQCANDTEIRTLLSVYVLLALTANLKQISRIGYCLPCISAGG